MYTRVAFDVSAKTRIVCLPSEEYISVHLWRVCDEGFERFTSAGAEAGRGPLGPEFRGAVEGHD